MPQIKQNFANIAFYLYRLHPQTGAIDGPLGTGFFLTRPDSRHPSFRHNYAITNSHLIEEHASIIRVNTIDGKSRFIEFDPLDWQISPSKDDLCAIDVSDHLRFATDEVAAIPEKDIITPEFVALRKIGFGEEVFMIGLFAGHPGNDRNAPTARFGNVAQMADERIPVKLDNQVERPCHLADMRSRTGFSGSPVFLYRTPNADLTDMDFPGGPAFMVQSPVNFWMGLFGVHCGQFPEEIKLRKAAVGEKFGDPIAEGDSMRIPSSMTIIVPAERITELLDLPQFEAARMQREKFRHKDFQTGPVPEGVSEPPTTDDSPAH